MRLAVASCWAYRDAWRPFFALLQKFWPAHPVPTLITDIFNHRNHPLEYFPLEVFKAGENATWCQAVSKFAATTNEPILLMQEDFFLTEPVNERLIERGLQFLNHENIGCVRVYPCPGGDSTIGDEHYAFVERDAEYRVSCQAAIWKTEFLKRMADHAMGSAASFEISGTRYARAFADIVLAFKRDVQPWPMQYICSGISRGMWNPDSKNLCDIHGIQNDWSMRPFAS